MNPRSVLRQVMVLATAGIAIACGTGSGGSSGTNGIGSASVMGTIQGAAFTPMDAVSSSPGNVTITDFAGLCAHGISDAKPSATYIHIIFDGGFQMGTTQVGVSLHVGAEVFDSQCNSFSDIASSGSVTLTTIDASTVDGTFDFVTATRSHLTGSFSAPMCTAPGSTACK